MSTLVANRYVIMRGPQDGHDELFVSAGECGWTATQELDAASGFSSRLSAERWMETNGLGIDAMLWRPIRRADVAIKPKKFDPPFKLVVTDPLEAVRLTCELHDEYCDRVEAWLVVAGVQRAAIEQRGRPVPCMTMTSPRWAGLYSSGTHTCHYPVVYTMMAADWRIIVAHEVVHAYQKLFTGQPCGHGPDFYGMMRHAALEPITDHHHKYSVSEAKRLSEKLLPWWAMAREQGLLASLPCEVLTTKTKRKGVR